MLKCKDILYSDGNNNILITLVDGRCAVVNLEKGTVNIAILLDTFLKWENYDKIPTDKEKDLVVDIIEKPKKVYEYREEKKYLTDPATKKRYDEYKRQAGYKY